MDFKKVTAASNTQTRDLEIFEQKAGSTYAAINILAKRADQIAIEMKEELNRTLEQFGNNKTIWKKSLKTENKLRYRDSTSDYPNQQLSQSKSLKKTKSTSAKQKKSKSNDAQR